MLDDASKVSEDFAYYLAGIFVTDSDILFEQSSVWYFFLRSNFETFMITPLYDEIKSYNSNIFKDFFDNCVEKGVANLVQTFESNIDIQVGYTNNFLEKLLDDLISSFWKKLTNPFINESTIYSENTGYSLFQISISNDYLYDYTVKISEELSSSNIVASITETIKFNLDYIDPTATSPIVSILAIILIAIATVAIPTISKGVFV